MANNFQDVQQGAIDLIDRIKQEVKGLDDQVKQLNENVKKLTTSGGITPQKTVDQIKALEAEMTKLNSVIKKQEVQAKKLKEVREAESKKIKPYIHSLTQLASVKKAEAAASEKLRKSRLKEQDATNASRKALQKQKDATIKANLREQDAINSNRKALQKQKQAYIEANRPYSQLIANHKRAKAALQDAIVAHGKNSREVKKATIAYDKYNRKVLQAQKATSNFSKKGLGGVFRGFSNLLGAFGVVGGVMAFADFTKSVINTIKELDQLNFTLQAVVKNEGELARTKAFLTDLSMKYGSELLSTTNRYVKFNVAARQAGLTLKETERIFETVTETSAILGLKTDELTGVYLALEQMLSKGKVTTEELRRQLGERLPGAFDLMAKALKVTTAELDEMLKAGEVLSKEALPLLTDEIEKFYGLTGEGVDTLQTATQKLSSSWDLLIETLNNSVGIGGLWQGILEGLSDALNGVNNFIQGTQAVSKSSAFIEYFKELQDNIDDTIPKYKQLGKATSEMREIEEKIFKQREVLSNLKNNRISVPSSFIVKATKELGKLEGRYEALGRFKQLLNDKSEAEKKNLIQTILRYKQKNDVIDVNTDLVKLEKMNVEELQTAYDNLMKGVEERQKNTIPFYENLIKKNEELRSTLKDTNKEDLETAKNLTNQNKIYRTKIDLLRAINKAQKKVNKSSKEEIEERPKKPKINTEDFFDQQIANLKKEQKAVADTSKEHALYNQLIQNQIAAKEKLTGANKDEAESLKEVKDGLSDFFKTFQDDFFSGAGFDFLGGILTDMDGFKELLNKSEDDWAIWANSIMEVGQEAFAFLQQNQEAYFENQLYNLEQERDIAIQFAGDSTAAREEIERQYEEKRRAIQQKQAQAKKEQAMFNIAIDTAQAVVGFLAQQNYPLAIAAGVIGAAQLAVVAARPVPEFFRGTMNAPEGMALVDEKQPEVHTDRNGNIKSFGESSSNYRWLSSGDKIYKSHDEYFEKELSNVLSVNDVLPYREALSTSSPVINVSNGLKKEVFVREINRLGQKIMEKETSVTRIDKNGFYTGVRKNGAEIERQNNILNLKGGIV